MLNYSKIARQPDCLKPRSMFEYILIIIAIIILTLPIKENRDNVHIICQSKIIIEQ